VDHPATTERRDALIERLFGAAVATMDVFSVYIGERLGLYRNLAEHGPSRFQDFRHTNDRHLLQSSIRGRRTIISDCRWSGQPRSNGRRVANVRTDFAAVVFRLSESSDAPPDKRASTSSSVHTAPVCASRCSMRWALGRLTIRPCSIGVPANAQLLNGP
jgi:hypothetical protein